MEAQKKWALQKCHQELRTDIILANFWPACRKLLTEVEYLWIASKTNNVSAVDELVEILLTKTDREFDGFCEILNANGYEHWAKKLRESAQDKEGGVHGEPEPLKMDNSRVTSTLNGSGARPEGECMLLDTCHLQLFVWRHVHHFSPQLVVHVLATYLNIW